MHLKKWLFVNNLKVKNIAEALDTSYTIALYIVNDERKVSLINALKINKFTNGEVKLEELLFEEDYISLQKVEKYKKKSNYDLYLKDWIFINNFTARSITEALDINYGVFIYIINDFRKPSLLNALKIHKFTNGEVKLEKLLSEEDYISLQKVEKYKKQSKEDINVKKKVRFEKFM